MQIVQAVSTHVVVSKATARWLITDFCKLTPKVRRKTFPCFLLFCCSYHIYFVVGYLWPTYFFLLDDDVRNTRILWLFSWWRRLYHKGHYIVKKRISYFFPAIWMDLHIPNTNLHRTPCDEATTRWGTTEFLGTRQWLSQGKFSKSVTWKRRVNYVRPPITRLNKSDFIWC